MFQNPLNHCQHAWLSKHTLLRVSGDDHCVVCGATAIWEQGKIIHYDRDGGKLPYGKSTNTGD